MFPFLIRTLLSSNLVNKVIVKLKEQPSPARVPDSKSPIVC
jgi:hypothetical protein